MTDIDFDDIETVYARLLRRRPDDGAVIELQYLGAHGAERYGATRAIVVDLRQESEAKATAYLVPLSAEQGWYVNVHTHTAPYMQYPLTDWNDEEGVYTVHYPSVEQALAAAIDALHREQERS
jgi:hypothetical protein